MFRRRDKEPLWRRLANFIWPRSGFRRAGRYIGYRLLRLPGSPYAIGGGVACGVAVSFTPFIGLHIILGLALAWILRCNLVASVIGTVIGNPWTFPFIWAWIYKTGSWILGRPMDPEAAPLQSLGDFFDALGRSLLDGLTELVGLSDVIENGGMTWQKLTDVGQELILPMMIGAVPNMIFAWIMAMVPVYLLVASYQSSRRRRKRARALATREMAEIP